MNPIRRSPRGNRRPEEERRKLRQSRHRLVEASGSLGSSTGARGPVPSIELYQKEECPYSHAVRERLSRLGLDFVAHAVPDGDELKHRRLILAGGKDQIPFLIDHRTGIRLYESSAILSYLEREYGMPVPGWIAGLARGVGSRLRSRADQLSWVALRPVRRARALGRSLARALII